MRCVSSIVVRCFLLSYVTIKLSDSECDHVYSCSSNLRVKYQSASLNLHNTLSKNLMHSSVLNFRSDKHSSHPPRMLSCCCCPAIWQLLNVNLCAHGWSSETCDTYPGVESKAAVDGEMTLTSRGDPPGLSLVMRKVVFWNSLCSQQRGVAGKAGEGSERVYVMTAALVIAGPEV